MTVSRMRASMTRRIPSAASSTESPSGIAIFSLIASARSLLVQVDLAVQKPTVLRYPSTRSASVTVGSVPPVP